MLRSWTGRILTLLALEKIVQHVAVTIAFAVDARGIRDSVAVDYRWLMWLGALAAILFAIALAGLLRGASWSLPLLGGLAIGDIVGELIAQGTVAITLNVSFIVAVAILWLVVQVRRRPL
jgi:hypothetical protein